jgi:hypothetical protein
MLRNRLHETLDDVLDEFFAKQGAPAASAVAGAETVDRVGPIEPFTYAWPADYGTEEFRSGTAYQVPSIGQDSAVVVAWTTRYAWGRDRDRAVVFHRARPSDDANRWYPWTEFVETDTGMYAATIPDPARPRAVLRDSDPLPHHIPSRAAARADQVFDSIREGASLRLVVNKADETDMVRHGLWVAQLRGRI